jgi:ankyrin repeat protein
MTARTHPPTRTLSGHPDLAQLKRQAKELLNAFTTGDPEAAKEVHAHYRGAKVASFELHDAQLVLARAYGFESWPRFRAFVDGVTVRRLVNAVREDDVDVVRAMVMARPELVHVDVAENDEHRALHHAVLTRRPEIVRVLMEHGADARKGIWPHRAATTAFTLASERGYDEIVSIIETEERRRSSGAPLGTLSPSIASGLMDAFRRGDEDAMIATLDAHPRLMTAADANGRTALHWAAACLWPKLMAWLLDRGADAAARATSGDTPLDVIGDEAELGRSAEIPALMKSIAEVLLAHGAASTARVAIATGDAAWLRARQAEGRIGNGSRLLSHAVAAARPDMLTLLLDLGLDPDEATRVEGLEETIPTWGEPLRACAISGNAPLAEILLAHGANPNTNVYAASSAMYEAYRRNNPPMIALLERHGGRLTAVAVAELGLVERAATLLVEDAEGKTAEGIAGPASSVAQDLLWGAIESPSPEIVQLALAAVDWPPADGRWHGILENGLYLCAQSDRGRHLKAFRLVLDRCDPNVSSRRGTTLLHEVAASRGGLTAADRVAYATVLLDRGARLDVRDDLLRSTPLGWACRWGRVELVALLLERGADPVEADAEPWATPGAWAAKMGHDEVQAVLRKRIILA